MEQYKLNKQISLKLLNKQQNMNEEQVQQVNKLSRQFYWQKGNILQFWGVLCHVYEQLYTWTPNI